MISSLTSYFSSQFSPLNLPLTSYLSPLTSYLLPLTTYYFSSVHSRTTSGLHTSHLSPLTSYLLLLTTYIRTWTAAAAVAEEAVAEAAGTEGIETASSSNLAAPSLVRHSPFENWTFERPPLHHACFPPHIRKILKRYDLLRVRT